MTFGETLHFLSELVGKAIDVSICIPGASCEEQIQLASFSGLVDRVSSSPPGQTESGVWRLWFERDPSSPMPGTFLRDERRFEHAEVQTDTPPPEERSDIGMTWTLTIRQAGLWLTCSCTSDRAAAVSDAIAHNGIVSHPCSSR
jgi:hypothetical protein